MVAPQDVNLFTVTDDVERAVREITGFYRIYHSLRYVRDVLVLRLTAPVSAGKLETLNQEFADILVDGRILPHEPFPEEANEPEIAHLPRLALHFDRHHYSRLRALIDRINGWDRERGILVDDNGAAAPTSKRVEGRVDPNA
jgi:hypothetical protein